MRRMDYIGNLIEIGSHSLSACAPDISVPDVLQNLLAEKNGFYAFENCLHIFPSNSDSEAVSLEIWNNISTWKFAYNIDFASIVFFAEDVFGNQFGIDGEAIVRFDVESGAIEEFAVNIDGWAQKILDDYDFETGYSLGRQWQTQNRPIRLNERLTPKIPFILGGDYSIENLYANDAILIMRFNGDLFNQIKNEPEGTCIELTTG